MATCQISDARDYSLVGSKRPGCRSRRGNPSKGEWYHSAFDRQEMKALMARCDGPALRDTAIWWGVMPAAAVSASQGSWGSAMALPFLALYGVLYERASDSRWHECGHGTAFRTPWMNNLSLPGCELHDHARAGGQRVASHARHHTDTLIVGRDPEIAVKRPPNIPLVLLSFLAIEGVYKATVSMVRHGLGRLTADEREFIPERMRARVFRTARLWLAIHLSSVALSLILQSWIPVVLIGALPTMYGAWLARLFDLTQHAGLAENVLRSPSQTRAPS